MTVNACDLFKTLIFSFFFPLTEIGPVPPNATVVFEVELFSVSRGPRSMEAFGKIDIDKDKSLTKKEVTTFMYEKKLLRRKERLKGLFLWS